jgi:hypothetical protein
MDLREVEGGNIDGIDLAREAGSCECGTKPSGSITCGELLD